MAAVAARLVKKKRETPDAFDREAGLRSTSCYSSAVFTSLRLVLFSYLSVSSVRRSIFLIVSRRVCAGFGRRLQTVVLFVCHLSGAEKYPPPTTPRAPPSRRLCQLGESHIIPKYCEIS